MGAVYRARDVSLGREVAIKLIPANLTVTEESLARFEREAKLLASLNHPGIAGVYGLEQADATRFLSMELVDGGTLNELLRSQPLPLEQTLTIALDIATSLEAAHALCGGPVHRLSQARHRPSPLPCPLHSAWYQPWCSDFGGHEPGLGCGRASSAVSISSPIVAALNNQPLLR
jgi:serine/threonine protein kinase